MRVALFTETYLPHVNGVVTHVKSLKDGLEALGHEVLIVCADANAKTHYIDEDHILRCPAKTSKKFYGYGLSFPYSQKRLDLLRSFHPDIVHIHNEFGIGLFGVHAAKKLKIPMVYTLHTMYDEYIYYVSPKLFLKPMTALSHKYFKYFAKRAQALTGPSKKVSEYFQKIGIKKPVFVIPNPVDLDSFTPDNISEEKTKEFRIKYHIPVDSFVICFCGRLGREKSADVLLEYFSQTVTSQDNIRLVIIGDGPCRKELEKQAKDLNISDLVCFTGKVMHDEIPPYYASCDLYVTASLSDTNSISMLEGMATGLPVLQRYDELNKDQVVNGKNGFTFQSAQEFYQELKRLQAMPKTEMNALRESVRKSVQNAGPVALGKNLESIYLSLIENKE